MRTLLTIALASALSLCPAASGQEVFRYVYQSAQRAAGQPGISFAQRKIAQFKLAALDYMLHQSAGMPHAPMIGLLDDQAYYLSEYLTLFCRDIVKAKRLGEDKRRARIALFMEASKSHPLFFDPDQQTTDAFINSGSELTPFCLDTDWAEAYKEVKRRL